MKCLSNHTIINLLKDDKARLEYSSNEYIFIKLFGRRNIYARTNRK